MVADESLASTDTELDSNWFSQWVKLKTESICLRLAPLAVSHNGSTLCFFFSAPLKPPIVSTVSFASFCYKLGFKHYIIVIHSVHGEKMTWLVMHRISYSYSKLWFLYFKLISCNVVYFVFLSLLFINFILYFFSNIFIKIYDFFYKCSLARYHFRIH